ncbi:MAG TPA: isoleucine--tRNA ligase, partial [Paenibacillaceae bacterium]|nr:isoleucine--tRNA ligase [Paenibacillaceae bacterium]
APYKRVLSLGHVLDENGQKMSKSRGNALDPVELINNYGADALRWALLADSAPWNPKRFAKRNVQEAKSKVIDTLFNVYGFYALYANIDGYEPGSTNKGKTSKLDEWILSRLHNTIKGVNQSMEEYEFTKATREIAAFVEGLSNWYVRRSRDRFWSQQLTEDKLSAYGTLHEVLVKTSQLIAPFAPFVADEIYSNLEKGSVHLTDYPGYDETLINDKLEEEMSLVMQVVELGRNIRNTTSLKTKQPLSNLILVKGEGEKLPWESYGHIIKEELNVKNLQVVDQEDAYLSYQLKLDFKKAGPKFGQQIKIVNQWVQNRRPAQVKEFVHNGEAAIHLDNGPLTLSMDDVLIEKVPVEGYALASNESLTVILDTKLTETLVQEGLARELLRGIQEYRKKLNLPVHLYIDLEMKVDEEMKELITNYEHLLQENLLLNSLRLLDELNEGEPLKVGGREVTLRIVNGK